MNMMLPTAVFREAPAVLETVERRSGPVFILRRAALTDEASHRSQAGRKRGNDEAPCQDSLLLRQRDLPLQHATGNRDEGEEGKDGASGIGHSRRDIAGDEVGNASDYAGGHEKQECFARIGAVDLLNDERREGSYSALRSL
jgi:hypothetical protein